MLNEYWSYIFSIIVHLDGLAWVWTSAMPLSIISVLIILISIELKQHQTKPSRAALKNSYQTNFATFIVNNLMLSVFSVSSVLLLAEQYSLDGLLTGFDYPLQISIAIILFDLTLYAWHRACHRFNSLWLFHKVHHSDPSLNTSTSFRVHGVELILTTLIKAMFVLITGIDAISLTICEAVTLVATLYHHAKLPPVFESALKWLFIVPGLHRVHHSRLRAEHDNNYGAVLSIWDRLFGSFRELKPAGIGLTNIRAMNCWQLFWYGLTSRYTSANNDIIADLERKIAEAAYYKAELHGFASGHELNDWLDAEQEIRQLYNV